MMFCGGQRHSWLDCLPIIENMWLKMAIETLPGECRIYYRADQQHPGYEINSICGEPEERPLQLQMWPWGCLQDAVLAVLRSLIKREGEAQVRKEQILGWCCHGRG